MTRAFASCRLSGDNFSPQNLLKRLPNMCFQEAHEPGEVSKYTKGILPHGGAIINHPSNLNKLGDKIAWEDMLDFLVKKHQIIRDCEVEDIDLTLNFFYQDKGGASWYVEDKEVKLLAELGIGLSIDWYHIEDKSAYPDHIKGES